MLCRPALPQDEDQVRGFLKYVWDGEDYVPEQWTNWLWDEPGLLAVAVQRGRACGMGHMLDLGEGEAWLEGLRVDPHFSSQGIGTHLHNYFVNRWLSSNFKVVRLATHVGREAVHRMCEHTGFTPLFRVQLAVAELDPGRRSKLKLEDAQEPASWLERLASSQGTTACAGLFDYGWRFGLPSPSRLKSMPGLALLDGGLKAGACLLQRSPAEGQPARIVGLSTDGWSLELLLHEVRRWAGERLPGQLEWLAPLRDEYVGAARAAGFTLDPDQTLVVYERSQ